jgi:hypothetical protein
MSRVEKLKSFLRDIKCSEVRTETVKSFSIEEFEEEQRKMRNRKNGKSK